MLKEAGAQILDDDHEWVRKHEGKYWTKNAKKMGWQKSVLLGLNADRLGTPRERMKWKAVQLAWIYGIGVEEVLGEGRRKIAFRPKIRFYLWLRAKGLSFPQIGALVGRDRTSVQHLIRQAGRYGLKNLMEKENEQG